MPTANGAITLRTSGSQCLDLFFFIGSARRHPSMVVQRFAQAFELDPQLALRILLWSRDARQGAGERDTFRNSLHWLGKRHAPVLAALIRSGAVQQLGRWDDLFHLQGEGAWPEVVGQVRAGLEAKNGLLAKWLPRKGPVAAKFCQALGYTASDWRKLLVANSHTVEQALCAGKLDSINYSEVPSVAAARYASVFQAKDGERYEQFLAAVSAGKTKVNAGAVFPHDILRASWSADAAATALWAALPRPQLEGKALVMCDVSGSMTVPVSGSVRALDVCVSLGLLLAESLPEPFRNQVLTFSEVPAWHKVTGDTLLARASSLLSADWGTGTDFELAMRAVLNKALTARVGGVEVEMPEYLIVLSDMEFNAASARKTNHDTLRDAYAAAGVRMPKLIYWNLSGRGNNVPASTSDDVFFVSGYSPSVASALLSGDFASLTPEALMMAVVGNPRYDVDGVTV